MFEDLYWGLYDLKSKVEQLEKIIEELQQNIYFLTERITILENINKEL